jgi:Mg2+/Co2+ transporter CorC
LQQAERFTLLERAIVPESAMGGGNKKLAVAGAAASLILGLVLAFVMDLIHPVVRTAAQMERQLDLRPVVSIPEIKPERAKRKPLLRGFGRSAEDKMVLGLPLYAVLSGAVTLVLLAAAALV